MAGIVRIEVKGLAELQTLITGLDRGFKLAARRAMEAGTTVQLQAARGELRRERTGLLKKSLGKRITSYPSGTVVGVVGPRRGFKVTLKEVAGSGRRARLIGTRLTRQGAKVIKLKAAAGVRTHTREGKNVYLSPAQYVHLVEGGTRIHRVGKGSSIRRSRQGGKLHPGARADDFLHRARNRTERQVLDTVKQHLAAGLRARNG